MRRKHESLLTGEVNEEDDSKSQVSDIEKEDTQYATQVSESIDNRPSSTSTEELLINKDT